MTHVDPQTFRHLLGSFATGITVLTTLDESGQPIGMTASAVAAVSLDPPLLLVCIGKHSSCHDILLATDAFVLNVLAEGQEELSDQFATDATDRFRNIADSTGSEDLPLLEGVAAHIVCRTWKHVNAGDHTIFLGSVIRGTAHDRAPLLHFRGAYGALR